MLVTIRGYIGRVYSSPICALGGGNTVKSDWLKLIPKAKTEGLVIRDLGPETIVYDLDLERAHCLNPVAAEIWRHCDGRRTISELAEMDSGPFRTQPAGERVELVRLAVAELEGARLLEGELENVNPGKLVSRREAVRRFRALAVLPVVMTLMQPDVAGFASHPCSPCNTAVCPPCDPTPTE